MHHLKRLIKFLLKWTVYGLLLLVLLFGLTFLFIRFTAVGEKLAANIGLSLLSTADQTIEVENLSGLLSGNFRIGVVRVSDTKGPFLVLNDVALDWSPLSLVSRQFKAAGLSIQTANLSRRPVKTLPETDGATSFSLPVTVKLDRFDLPKLEIGPFLAGRPVTLAMNADLEADNSNLASTLSVSDAGGGHGHIAGKINFRPADDALQLALDAEDEANGLLGQLLNLQNAPALKLALTGTGPLSDWKGKLTAKANEVDVLAIEGSHKSLADGQHQISLLGDAEIGQFMPAAFSALVKGKTSILLDALFETSGKLTVQKGLFASDSLSLSAQGSYDLAGLSDINAELTTNSGPVSVVLPLASGPATVAFSNAKAHLFGPSNDAEISLSAALPDVTIDGSTFSGLELSVLGSKMNLIQTTGDLALTFAATELKFANTSLDRLIKGPLNISANVTLDAEAANVSQLKIESGRMGGTITARIARQDFATQADFKLFALPDVLPDALSGKFEGTIALAGKIQASGSQNIEISDVTIASSTVSASGSASVTDGTLQADVQMAMSDIGRLSPGATGQIAVHATATGPMTTPTVTLDLNSSLLTLAGKKIENLQAGFSGALDVNNPAGKLSATGTVEKQAIVANGTLSSQNGILSLPDIVVDIGPNHLKGQIDLGAGGKPNGEISFAFPDISLIAALAGQEASGDIEGSATLFDADGKIGVALKASGATLRRGDAVVTGPQIDLASSDLQSAAVSGTVKAESAGSGAQSVSKITLAFNHKATETDFNLSGLYDKAPLKLTGSLSRTETSTQISLKTLQLSPQGIPVSLLSPATVKIENSQATLPAVSLQAGAGKLTLSGSAGSSLDLKIDLAAMPANLANRFSPGLGAEGTIAGTANVSGLASRPAIDFNLAWTGAAVSQTRSIGLAPFGVKAKGSFVDQKLTLTTSLSGDAGLALAIDGSIALLPSPTMNLKVGGQVPFALAKTQLAAAGLSLEGIAKLDLIVTGTPTAPVIAGAISTQNGKLVDVRHNLVVNALATTLTLTSQHVTISSFSGQLGTGGTIGLTGNVGIAPGSGFPADLAIKLSNASYTDGSLFSASMTGDLSINGPLLTSPVLGGKIAISRASITIPEKLPSSLSGMTVQHKNASQAVQNQNKRVEKASKPANGSKTGSGGLNLDLEVSAPSQVFIRGRGMDAELGGTITVKGNSASPLVSGGFKMLRGRLLLLGKRLDFSSGSVSFGGDLNPTLDLVATSESGSTTITVTVAGNAADPSVVFSSSPSLPQDEVLAQLIFGRSMTSLSALQIAKLADAVAQLSGGGSTSLFEKLRSGLGVDDLDVTTDDKGNAAVKAGKYLNDKTYLELQQGGDQSGGKATINLDIGQGVKLKGGVGTNGSGTGGIFYEKEY